MSREFSLKDTRREKSLVGSRIYAAGLIMLLLGLMLLGRIFYLQVIKHEHFTTLSQHNRVKILPLSPIRGLIFSRDGVLLADNRPSFSLEIIPELVDDMDQIIEQLERIVSIEQTDIKRFRQQLKKKRRFESVPLKFSLSDEEVARVSVNRHLYPGVDVVARLNRYYPAGENIAHAVGYVGMIDENDLKQLNTSNYIGTTHIGKVGIEKAYEDILHGRVGYQQVEVNAQGRVVRVLDRTPPQTGRNIHITLDVSLQNVAVEALAGKRGAIVAIDPRDGSILVLVSSPSYDPNLFVNGIDYFSYNKLLTEGTPLLNRALQGKYPPGSTIKPFIGLAVLNLGLRTVYDETWCPGWFTLPGHAHRYRDWKKQGHGHMSLLNAIAQSCDVYFYTLASELGINRLHTALAEFGFGEKTGIDIGGESAGLLPSRQWKRKALGQVWFPGETVIVGIGQGAALTTPLQLATATAAIATRGRMIPPHLLDETHEPVNNETIDLITVVNKRKIKLIESEYWDDIINAMTEVVHGTRGTARKTGLNAQYRFAGKTGTAQVIGIAQDEQQRKDEEKKDIPEKFRDHALFIAFAPVNDPKIAVAIVIENSGSGSSIAAPIARRLFDHYLVSDNRTQG
ncbi:MAG: penicillin-binding protein 2 [Gammaproteobacteria bacterium]|nr:penicillin-binding protein 2 [Gammaproteobacteria bacterium]